MALAFHLLFDDKRQAGGKKQADLDAELQSIERLKDRGELEGFRNKFAGDARYKYAKDNQISNATFDIVEKKPATLPATYKFNRPLMNVTSEGKLNEQSYKWCTGFCAAMQISDFKGAQVGFQVPVERPGKNGEDVNDAVAAGIKDASIKFLQKKRGVSNPQATTSKVYMTFGLLAQNIEAINCKDVISALINDATDKNFSQIMAPAQKSRLGEIGAEKDGQKKLSKLKQFLSGIGGKQVYFEHHSAYPGLVREYDKLRVALVPYDYSLYINRDGFLEVRLDAKWDARKKDKEFVFNGIDGKRAYLDYGTTKIEGTVYYDKGLGYAILIDNAGDQMQMADLKKLDGFGKSAVLYYLDDLGKEQFLLKIIRTDLPEEKKIDKPIWTKRGYAIDARFVTDASIQAVGFVAGYSKQVPGVVESLAREKGNNVGHSDISEWKSGDAKLDEKLKPIYENDPENYEKFFKNVVETIEYYLQKLKESRRNRASAPKIPELISHKNIVMLTDLGCTDKPDFVTTGGLFSSNTAKHFKNALDDLKKEAGIGIKLCILAVAPQYFDEGFGIKFIRTMDKFSQACELVGAEPKNTSNSNNIMSVKGKYGQIIWYYGELSSNDSENGKPDETNPKKIKVRADIEKIFNGKISELTVPKAK